MARWLLYSLVAVGIWGAWGVINTPASNALQPLPLQVFSTLGLAAVSATFLFSKNLKAGKNHARGFVYAVLTGLCGSCGNVAASFAISRGGEASVIWPLTSIYPLVTVVLARVFLGEKLNRTQLLGFALALAALLVSGLVSAGDATLQATSWPEKIFSPWMRYALVTLVLFGIAAVLQKLSTNNISNELSMVGFTLGFVAVATAIVATSSGWTWRIPGRSWGWALGYGALIGAGTLALFAAYRHGKASVVTAVTALYPALTVVLAVPLLGDRLSALKVVMILLSLAAGVALTFEAPAAEEPPGA